MKQPIDLRPDHAKIVHEIIARHLPAGVCVRVFGSRAKWTAKPHSDLDLALKGKEPLPRSVLGDLAEAFSESDLPFRVDIVDWHNVAPSFQAVIDRDGVRLTVPLGEVAKLLSGGTPSKSNSSLWNGDVPWLTPKDMGQWNGTTDAHVTRAAIGKGTKLAPENASFVAVRGMSLHNEIRVVRSERPLTFNQDIKAVVAGPSMDSDFLYYALTASKPVLLGLVSAAGHGTGVLDTDRLRSLEIPVLPVEEQQSIAKTISALDDKIELNRRMNETLEGMAQAIFRDWFVDFGPVRRKAAGETDAVAIMGGLTPDPARAAQLATLFPAELGNDGLPVGWTLQPVSAFADLRGGKQLEKQHILPVGPNPVFGGAGIMGYATISNADGYVITVGRVGAYCGQFFGHRGAAWVNNNASLIKPLDSTPPEWLLLALRESDIESIKRGAAQPFVSNGDVGKLPLVDAGAGVRAAFEEFIRPQFLLSEARQAESETLAETRDYLLPRLMSGTVRVDRESEAA